MQPPAATSRLNAYVAWRRKHLARPGLALALVSVLFALVWLVALLPMQIDITFPEATQALRAAAVARGEPAYRDWHAWPHTFAPYSPGFYYAPGLLMRLTGISPTVRSALLLGRAWSLASVLLLLIVICWGVRRSGVAAWWGLPALAMALQWQSLWEYCASYRPDPAQVLLSVLAVVLLLDPQPATFTRRRLWLAFAALWLGFWLKASSFGVLLGLLFFVGVRAGWKKAATAAFIFAASGLALFALLNHLWQGRLVLNMLVAERNGIDLAFLKGLFTGMLQPRAEVPAQVLPFALALLALVLLFAQWRTRIAAAPAPESAAPRALLITLPLSLLTSTLLAMKAGSDRNYFIEPLALATILFGWLLGRAWEKLHASRTLLREVGLAALLLFIAGCVVQQAQAVPRQLRGVRAFYAPTPAMQLAAAAGAPVLATDSYLAAVAGNGETIGDKFMYDSLCRSGALSPAPLAERINREQFPLLILHDLDPGMSPAQQWNHFYGDWIWPLIDKHYIEAERIGPHRIWRPRGAASSTGN